MNGLMLLVAGVSLVLVGCSQNDSSGRSTADGAVTRAPASTAVIIESTPWPTASPVPPTATPKPPTPLTPSDLLGGNAVPAVPAGEPGKMSVVYVGRNVSVTYTELPVIIRNNTSSAVNHVELFAGAKDTSGKIVASGQSQGFHPTTIQPGGASLGFVFFSSQAVPQNANFDFSFQTFAPKTSGYAAADLKVTQANLVNGHIVGGATNGTGIAIEGSFGEAFCFDGSGTLVDSFGLDVHGPDRLEPGGSVTFDVGLGSASCPTFLVGVSAYYP